MTHIPTPQLHYCDVCGVQGDVDDPLGPFRTRKRIHIDDGRKDGVHQKYSDVCHDCVIAIAALFYERRWSSDRPRWGPNGERTLCPHLLTRTHNPATCVWCLKEGS